MEDYDSCGIFGEGEKAAEEAATTNRARIGDEYDCLWDCQWQVNPFFKSEDVFPTKIGTKADLFPMIHTSPRLPTNLTCLEDCFGFYKNPKNPVMMKKRAKKVGQCSSYGFDTQVPTHHEPAVKFAASHYSDMALWLSTWIASDRKTTIGSWNPNLDCLILLESIRKQHGEHVGNFIPQGNVFNNQRGVRSVFRSSNDGSLPPEGNRILRASNPLSTALEICVFAKLLQYVKTVRITFPDTFTETVPELNNLFDAGPKGCDSFLPDLFSQTNCRCVGTCDPLTSSLLFAFDSDFPNTVKNYATDPATTLFTTEPGLMGCQNACNQTATCNYFTFSYETSANLDGSYSMSKKHVCRLWNSCNIFQIPAGSTYSNTITDTISAHWSGPKECAGQQYTCPILPDDSDSYTVRMTYIGFN